MTEPKYLSGVTPEQSARIEQDFCNMNHEPPFLARWSIPILVITAVIMITLAVASVDYKAMANFNYDRIEAE